MNPRIDILKEKKLVGQCIKMSLTDNKTLEVWSEFGPRIKEIQNKVSDVKISMQIYPPKYHKQFEPNNEFEKWAAVEVEDFENIHKDMTPFILKQGLYAIFQYKGLSSDPSIFQYIFTEWLPNSNCTVDDRPHFELLGEKYKNNDPNSEEEIWIPIREK